MLIKIETRCQIKSSKMTLMAKNIFFPSFLKERGEGGESYRCKKFHVNIVDPVTKK